MKGLLISLMIIYNVSVGAQDGKNGVMSLQKRPTPIKEPVVMICAQSIEKSLKDAADLLEEKLRFTMTYDDALSVTLVDGSGSGGTSSFDGASQPLTRSQPKSESYQLREAKKKVKELEETEGKVNAIIALNKLIQSGNKWSVYDCK